jgi:hypothetical protein
MFQYAFGKRLAAETNQRVKFDIDWFKDRNNSQGTDRNFTIDGFDVDIECATDSERSSVLRGGRFGLWLLQNGHIIERIPRGPQLAAKALNYFREVRSFPGSATLSWPHRRLPYLPILEVESDAYFDGYWYSYKYFEEISDAIRDDFSVPNSLSGKDAEIADRIAESTAVSIHIRRGDKVTQGPDEDPLGNALPASYYYEAASYITDRADDVHYFVFSDDPEWAIENLEFDRPTTYVTHNDGSTDYLDLALMSRCDHQTIASSGFSWWAAWLNTNDDKIVTVPRPWSRYGYPTGSIDRWDFIPEDWVTLSYDDPLKTST